VSTVDQELDEQRQGIGSNYRTGEFIGAELPWEHHRSDCRSGKARLLEPAPERELEHCRWLSREAKSCTSRGIRSSIPIGPSTKTSVAIVSEED